MDERSNNKLSIGWVVAGFGLICFLFGMVIFVTTSVGSSQLPNSTSSQIPGEITVINQSMNTSSLIGIIFMIGGGLCAVLGGIKVIMDYCESSQKLEGANFTRLPKKLPPLKKK
jgi:drug/metabolite transporter (DMT)-like permease